MVADIALVSITLITFYLLFPGWNTKSDSRKAHEYLRSSLESRMLLYCKSDANLVEVTNLHYSVKKCCYETLQHSDPNNVDAFY